MKNFKRRNFVISDSEDENNLIVQSNKNISRSKNAQRKEKLPKRRRVQVQRFGARESMVNYDSLIENALEEAASVIEIPETAIESSQNCPTIPSADDVQQLLMKVDAIQKYMISLDCRLKEFVDASKIQNLTSNATQLQAPFDLPISFHENLRIFNEKLRDKEFKLLMVCQCVLYKSFLYLLIFLLCIDSAPSSDYGQWL